MTLDNGHGARAAIFQYCYYSQGSTVLYRFAEILKEFEDHIYKCISYRDIYKIVTKCYFTYVANYSYHLRVECLFFIKYRGRQKKGQQENVDVSTSESISCEILVRL